ncbi:MAG TPA: hypothetical protein VF791_10505 [Pyrinomonadaceae bacterium]
MIVDKMVCPRVSAIMGFLDCGAEMRLTIGFRDAARRPAITWNKAHRLSII